MTMRALVAASVERTAVSLLRVVFKVDHFRVQTAGMPSQLNVLTLEKVPN